MKYSVLFVCVHNSARSQMAEELLRLYGGDSYHTESAGYEPAEKVNPLVIEVMKELDVDLEEKTTQNVYKIFENGREFDYVITVCKECLEQGCPFFPYKKEFLKWGFDDPAGLNGTHKEKIDRTREIREEIKAKILEFIEKIKT